MDPDRLALEALAAFEPEFADPDVTFGTWSSADSIEDDGPLRLPYVELSEVAARFLRTCAENDWIRPDFDWPDWVGTPEARRLREDPDALAAATADDLAHLLTALVRGDRFYEGQLLGAFESGLLQRIVERAARLVEATPRRPDA
jgi:Family of unknown function (DUF6508)